jgi:hypothetical protein
MQSQCKHTLTKKQGPPRCRPAYAASQREEILRLLQEAGPRGVLRADLIFNRHFTQCGARVDELKQEGHIIRSEQRGGRYPTWYVPEREALSEANSGNGGDWYERQTGEPRPRATDDSPLFGGSGR